MDLQDFPVYKLWMDKWTLDAWKLTDEQTSAALQKHDEFMAQVGGKTLLIADCVWSNEEFNAFGVQEFPNLEALITYHHCLKELDWFGYTQTKSYLGWVIDEQLNPIPLVPPPPLEPDSRPIYKVALFRPTPLAVEEGFKQMEGYATNPEVIKSGVVNLITAYCRMNNEEWMQFSVERYPSLNAFGGLYAYMETTNWWKYVESKTILGVATGGIFSGLEP